MDGTHAALAYDGVIPPKLGAKLHETKTAATRIPANSVTISEDGLSARVKSTAHERKVYTVVFTSIKDCNGAGCDGGCMVHSGVPCAHAVAAATKKGVTIESLMHPFDTTEGWRAQYEESIELPSSADVDAYAHLVIYNFLITDFFWY